MRTLEEYKDDVSYVTIYQKKDKSMNFLLSDLNTKLSFSITTKQLQKIIDNPNKPITIKKAYRSRDGYNGNGQVMVAYFQSRECFMVYIGKIGITIRSLKEDIATNGEIKVPIDIKQIQLLLEGVLSHEFAVMVAQKREEERTDYLDESVELPVGKWFSEESIEES